MAAVTADQSGCAAVGCALAAAEKRIVSAQEVKANSDLCIFLLTYSANRIKNSS